MIQSDIDVNIIVLIKAHYNTLRTSEKKIADYILNHPDTIIYSSITTLAKEVSVSETSVIRFCKSLGFNGFQDFKINLARQLAVPRQQIDEDISKYDDTATIINKVTTANINAIQETIQFLDPAKIDQAVQAIAGTSRLEFYGVGGSGAVAQDAQHDFFKYINGSCIAYTDSHMQAMSASTMSPGDVAVGISHSGATKDIVESLEIAKKAGATIIGITGGMSNRITEICDISLQIVSREQHYRPGLMSSRLAALTILDILATGVAFSDPEHTMQVMEKTNAALKTKKY